MTRYSNQVIPMQINPRDIVTTIPMIQGINLVDNPTYISTNNSIEVYDPSTNTVVKTIAPPNTTANYVFISKNNTTLYTMNNDTNLIYYSLTSNQITGNIALPYALLYTIAISNDGNTIYLTDATQVELVVDVAQQKVTNTIALSSGTFSSALSPNGKILYISCQDKIMVIDTKNYKTISNIAIVNNNDDENIIVCDNGNKLYLAISVTGYVNCYNTNSGTLIASINVGNSPYSLAVSPDDKFLYVGNDAGGAYISVIDIKSNYIVSTIATPFSNISDLKFTSDGSRLYATESLNSKLLIIDPSTNTVITTLNTVLINSVVPSYLPTFLCGQGIQTIIVDEQVGANKTFQFDIIGGYDNVLSSSLQNYNYINNSQVNCTISSALTNVIQLTTIYSSTFIFTFSKYPTIQPIIHRLTRGGSVTSANVSVTVRSYSPKVVW